MKAIIFDFVGVLAVKSESHVSDDISESIDAKIGSVVDDDKFRTDVMKEYRISSKEFDEVIEKIAGKYAPYKPLWDILPALKSKYKLCIINNGTAFTLPTFKKTFQIDDYFDVFLSSAVEGLRKPDPRIYKLAIDRLGVKPNDVLFMDDSLQNIDAAKGIGIETIYWKTPEEGFGKFINHIDWHSLK